MNNKPLYHYNGIYPVLDTQERLTDFLRRTYHETTPQLWRCRWSARDAETVYLWYRGECNSVDASVVRVLKQQPKPTRLIDKIINFFI
jgi:hypothetical protein